MDSCQRFKEMVSDYIEGELDHQSHSVMEKHLRDCLGCTQAISRLKSLIRKLRELPKLSVSPDFETILRARISMESSLARHRSGGWLPVGQIRIPAYAFTAVFLIMAMVTVFFIVKPDRYLVPQANVNKQWYKAGVEKFDPATNERYFYIIETQPVPNVNSQFSSDGNEYPAIEKKTASDSIQTYKDTKLWLETVQTIESKVY